MKVRLQPLGIKVDRSDPFQSDMLDRKKPVEILSSLIANLEGPKGGSEARKADGVATELTEAERRFLKEAIRRMIRRAAEKAYDPHKNLPEISLSDLP